MADVIETCAIVILAAGGSSRLGQPKQLLSFQNKSLIQHAVQEATQTQMRPILVVVGAHEPIVAEELKATEVDVVNNENWEEGISSSMRCGLNALQQMNPKTETVIFMVCDQPFVNKALLESLFEMHKKSGLPIVASSYEKVLGTPVLFHKSLFSSLQELTGDTGARKLIRQFPHKMASVAFPEGEIDIDTVKDYEKLMEAKK